MWKVNRRRHDDSEQQVAAHEWLMRLDSYANETYGRPVTSAVVNSRCVACDGRAHTFTTPAAVRVYSQSGLCERCQNAYRSISDNIVPFNQNYRID